MIGGGQILFNVKFFTKPSQMVVHWGGPLRHGDWVMVGERGLRNWFYSGIWIKAVKGNEKYNLRAGVQNVVPNQHLRWPPGWDKLQGTYGQRMYVGPTLP